MFQCRHDAEHLIKFQTDLNLRQMMQGTVSENAAGIRRVCKRFDQPKAMKQGWSTLDTQGRSKHVQLSTVAILGF